MMLMDIMVVDIDMFIIKTAAMLYNLQYVLGDELFLKSMKHYFNNMENAMTL